MTPTAAPRRASASGGRVFAGLAAVALLAFSGCNRSHRDYPTISATAPDAGGVKVKGTYNHCPFALFTASPDHTAVGQSISLTASASDEDGDALTYVWTASAGIIVNPNTAATSFTCVHNGAVTITLTVSDSSCLSTTSGSVICQPSELVPDGGAAGSFGATGAGGQAGTGVSTTGAAGSIGAVGAGGMGGMAGSGVAGTVGSAGTTGSGASGGTTGSGGGGGTVCVETNPPAAQAADCTACLMPFQTGIEGCCTIEKSDPTGFSLCQAVSACMRSGNCNAMGDTQACYCGTHVGTCDNPGQANGPCVSQVTAAAGRNVTMKMTDSPSPAQVLSRFADTAYAIGRASAVHLLAGGFCATECGVGM
jgi:hypothetical protein